MAHTLDTPSSGWRTCLAFFGAIVGLPLCLTDWIGEPLVGRAFDSESLRLTLMKWLSGNSSEQLLVSSGLLVLLLLGITWGAGALGVWLLQRGSFSRIASRWGEALSFWACLAGSWSFVRYFARFAGWRSLEEVLISIPEFWLSVCVAGALANGWCLCDPVVAGSDSTSKPRIPWLVVSGMVMFVVVFGAMNTRLWQNLLIPHGDSAMYEEHLWNLLHGKGFRSEIDRGLFFGEHIQVVHLLLLPVYVIWPSHLLMEWCESMALASGAWLVYRLSMRASGSSRIATGLALSYLLYVPMQRLEISVDFKTFRPEAFGIPIVLATLNAYEARRWGWTVFWMGMCLAVKEDLTLVLGPLGLWMAWEAWRQPAAPHRTRWLVTGLLVAVLSVVYLLVVLKVLFPYFRSGREIHYTSYFSVLGKNFEEIISSLIFRPGLWLGLIFQSSTSVFAASLWVPVLMFLPWAASRLLVCIPLFFALSLADITRTSQHHFHAPLVALTFWAITQGFPKTTPFGDTWLRAFSPVVRQVDPVRWGVLAACGCHLWHSLTPLGLPFWDSTSGAYWGRKYVSNPRAAMVEKVLAHVPPGSSVASTDFIHPRFNHFPHSYDYSSFRPDLPPDTEYLVIDVTGPYSQIRTPYDVEIYRKHPDDWELLPDDTNGLFYIFKRVRK